MTHIVVNKIFKLFLKFAFWKFRPTTIMMTIKVKQKIVFYNKHKGQKSCIWLQASSVGGQEDIKSQMPHSHENETVKIPHSLI